ASITHFSTLSLHDALPISFAASRGGRFPVQRAEVSLPGEMPFAIQLRDGALAGAARTLAVAATRTGSRPVLRRMLLGADAAHVRSEEHTSELQSRSDLVCR